MALKTKLLMVFIPVDYNESRRVAEELESLTFESETDLGLHLSKELVQDEVDEAPSFYNLSDFTQMLNDDTLDTGGGFFAYVYIIVPPKFD